MDSACGGEGDDGHGEALFVGLKELAAHGLESWGRNEGEGLGVDVEPEYLGVALLDNLGWPVQGVEEEDGRDVVGRNNPVGQLKIKVGAAAANTGTTNAPPRRYRRAQCEDPVLAKRPHAVVVQHFELEISTGAWSEELEMSTGDGGAGRVEAGDVVVKVERREGRPATRAGVSSVEPGTVGEEEDAGA
jgi:hypothetical protein